MPIVISKKVTEVFSTCARFNKSMCNVEQKVLCRFSTTLSSSLKHLYSFPTFLLLHSHA